MKIDLFTYMIINQSITLILIFYLFFIWLEFRKRHRGIGHFLIGLTLFFTGTLMISFQLSLPPVIGVCLGNSIVALGAAFFFLSFRRFYSKKVSLLIKILVVLLVSVLFLEQILFYFIYPRIIVRMVSSSLVLALFFFLAFLEQLKYRNRNSLLGNVLMIAFLLNTIVILTRVPLSFLSFNSNLFMMEISGWNTINIYLFYTIIISWPIGFSLLISNEDRWQEMKARKDREVLLKELYHRTKNNMNVIISMMELYKEQSRPASLDHILTEMQDRIFSMSLVHEKLYSSRDLSSIPLDEYIKELVANLGQTKTSSLQLSWDIQIDNISLLIDYAIPCGLVVNELISNSLKHAFSDDMAEGCIKILCYRDKSNSIVLEYSDNGKGLPESFNEAEDGKMGMQLIRTLSEGQLLGSLEMKNLKGLFFRVTFKEDNYSNRLEVGVK